MTYKWKLESFYPVDAQDAGEELDRIYQKHGGLSAKDIVDESRSETAPLHPCFEWNDAVAAEKYRENQASDIVRAIVMVAERDEESREVRAFVHVEKTYQPFTVVATHEEKMGELLETASRELGYLEKRFANLSALCPFLELLMSCERKVRDRIEAIERGE